MVYDKYTIQCSLGVKNNFTSCILFKLQTFRRSKVICVWKLKERQFKLHCRVQEAPTRRVATWHPIVQFNIKSCCATSKYSFATRLSFYIRWALDERKRSGNHRSAFCSRFLSSVAEWASYSHWTAIMWRKSMWS